MTTQDPMGRGVRAWLQALEQQATYLDDVMAAVAATPQKRTSRVRSWIPALDPFTERRFAPAIAVALLLAVLLGALLVAGAILRDRTPDPDSPPALAAFLIAERSNSAWLGRPLELEVLATGVNSNPIRIARISYFADGAGRYRADVVVDPGTAEEVRRVVLVGEGYSYVGDTSGGGVTTWYADTNQDHVAPYPLLAPYPCSGGWEYVDTAIVLGRVADHIRCGDIARVVDRPFPAGEAWIDRETYLVLKASGGVSLGTSSHVDGPLEVVAIRFRQPAPELFELPAGADPQPRT
jgi:hypothetical protein